MGFLDTLQESAFGIWVASAPTLLAYPTVLALHTVGLGAVVGSNLVVDLRLLGFGRDVPLVDLRRVFRVMWLGFALNLSTGVALFVAAAAEFGIMPMFYVKLSLITLALIIASRIRRVVFSDGVGTTAPIPQQIRMLAIVSLILWTGAITAGRLMAYSH
jgi:hypothetical protein